MINYILSDQLDYNLLICDDAGHCYANNMGWPVVKVSELNVTEKEIFAVDNRITADEAAKLEIIIRQNSDTTFLLKIVDPFMENVRHHYYEFLSRMSECANTFLLSVYQPTELADILKGQYKHRFIHLPYPYLKEREVERNSKLNRIVITGALNEQVYPYRYSVWKKVTRSWLRPFFFSILKHPGYAELSEKKQHAHRVVGALFVEHLSLFKYMLLCPTRCKIELLKFYECAYAGCMPVGEPPLSYPAEIAGMFLPLRPAFFVSDTLNIIRNGYDAGKVYTFRDFLRKTRSPECLNTILEKFLLENTLHTS